MPGRIYNLTAENGTIGTGNALVAISTAAAGSAAATVKVKRLEISQSGSTSLAMIRGEFITRTTAGTYTFTSTTPQPLYVGGAASGLSGNTAPAGGTARTGTFSSADSGGAEGTAHHFFNFSNLNGYLFVPTPDAELVIPPSTVWVCKFLAAPGTTTGWTISVIIEENG